MTNVTAHDVVMAYLSKSDSNEQLDKKAMDLSTIDPVLKTEHPLDQRETARAIRQAICAEHDAVHLYELIGDSRCNKEVKDVLQDIADEETVHIGELQQLLSILDIKNEEFLEEGREEAKEVLE